MGITAGFTQPVRILHPDQPDSHGTIAGIVVGPDGNTDLRVVLLTAADQEYTPRGIYIRLLVVHVDSLAVVS